MYEVQHMEGDGHDGTQGTGLQSFTRSAACGLCTKCYGGRHLRKRNSACATDPTRSTRAVPSRKSRMVQGFFDSDTPDPHYFWHKQRVQKPRHRFVDPAVQSVSALVAACILVSRTSCRASVVDAAGALMYVWMSAMGNSLMALRISRLGASSLVTQRQRPSLREGEQLPTPRRTVEHNSSAIASEYRTQEMTVMQRPSLNDKIPDSISGPCGVTEGAFIFRRPHPSTATRSSSSCQ